MKKTNFLTFDCVKLSTNNTGLIEMYKRHRNLSRSRTVAPTIDLIWITYVPSNTTTNSTRVDRGMRCTSYRVHDASKSYKLPANVCNLPKRGESHRRANWVADAEGFLKHPREAR